MKTIITLFVCMLVFSGFVFASNRDGDYEIFSASIEENSEIQLVSEIGRDWCPRTSPNRDKIVFTL